MAYKIGADSRGRHERYYDRLMKADHFPACARPLIVATAATIAAPKQAPDPSGESLSTRCSSALRGRVSAAFTQMLPRARTTRSISPGTVSRSGMCFRRMVRNHRVKTSIPKRQSPRLTPHSRRAGLQARHPRTRRWISRNLVRLPDEHKLPEPCRNMRIGTRLHRV
jgi:hypothetical protein